MCEVLPHFAATMHFIALPHIRLDGDVAQVDTYCIAHHVARPDDAGQATDMVLGLRYVDRFEQRDGTWLDRQAGVRLRLELHDPVRLHRGLPVRRGLHRRHPQPRRHHLPRRLTAAGREVRIAGPEASLGAGEGADLDDQSLVT